MNRQLTLRGLLEAIAVIALLAALGGTAAYAVARSIPERFRAEATYVIGPSTQLDDPDSIVRSFDSLQRQGIVPTFVEMLRSAELIRRTTDELGIDEVAARRYDVAAAVLAESNTLTLSVEGEDRDVVAPFATALGARAVALFETTYSVYEVTPLDRPVRPDERANASPFRLVVLAMALGGGLGVLAVVLRMQLTGLLGRGEVDRDHAVDHGDDDLGDEDEDEDDPLPSPPDEAFAEAAPPALVRT